MYNSTKIRKYFSKCFLCGENCCQWLVDCVWLLVFGVWFLDLDVLYLLTPLTSLAPIAAVTPQQAMEKGLARGV